MAEPMPVERLDEIRERMETATPGPWSVGSGTDIGLDIEPTQYGYTYSVILAKAADDEDRELDLWRPNPADRREVASAEDDALFIAHARQDVVDLLAEVERLKAELSRQAFEMGDLLDTLDATEAQQKGGSHV